MSDISLGTYPNLDSQNHLLSDAIGAIVKAAIISQYDAIVAAVEGLYAEYGPHTHRVHILRAIANHDPRKEAE